MAASARLLPGLAILLAAASAAPIPVTAAEPPPTGGVVLSPSRTFSEMGGEAIYANVCAGCHMPDGRGATGAGTYPALAGNGKLESASYPVYVLLFGLRGMPPLGRLMSDEQVADVATYLRTHLGNAFPDPVTPADVKAARP